MGPNESCRQLEMITIASSLSGILVLGAVGAPQLLSTTVIIFLFGSLIWVRAQGLEVSTTGPLLAFLIPLAIGIVNLHSSILPAFPDADLYHQLASQSAHVWWQGELLPSETYLNIRVQTYAYILGLVYALTSHAQLAGIAVNAGFWGLATAYWLRIGRSTLHLSRSSSGIAGLLFAFYPAGVLYSSALLRESITVFLLAVTCWHLSRWIRTQETRHLLVGTGVGVVLGLLRPELLPVLWLAAGVALLAADISKTRLVRTSIVGGLALVGAFLLQILSLNIPSRLNPFQLSLLEGKRAAEAARPYAYLTGMEYSSWFDIFTAIPLRLMYLLYSPFPWQLHSYNLFIVTMDALYVLILSLIALPALLWGVIDRRGDRLFLIGFATVLVVGYSLVISTEGVASRRRLYAMPVLFLFATYEIRRRIGEVRINW